jgi:peptidoglycan L-alanyl-D-glutamate endopeptidase CwlK
MANLSKKSRERLLSCDQKLQTIILELTGAIGDRDFIVLCGHRNKEEQTKAYDAGHSKAKWGQSKHNSLPSKGADIAPYPIDWNDTERFARLIGAAEAIAFKHNIKIRCGMDFNGFKDYPHIELIEEY